MRIKKFCSIALILFVISTFSLAHSGTPFKIELNSTDENVEDDNFIGEVREPRLTKDLSLIVVQFAEKPTSQKLLTLKKEATENKETSTHHIKEQLRSYANQINAVQNAFLSELSKMQIKYKVLGTTTYSVNTLSLLVATSDYELIKNLHSIKTVEVIKSFKKELKDDVINANRIINGKRKQSFSTDKNLNVRKSNDDVVVAVISTGIDYTRESLGGCIGTECKVISGVDLIEDSDDVIDIDGLGTDIAELIAGDNGLGVFPSAKLISIRAFTDGYFSTPTENIRAIEYALDPDGDPSTLDHADVIFYIPAAFGRVSDVQKQQIDLANSLGITVIMPSGDAAGIFAFEQYNRFMISDIGELESVIVVSGVNSERDIISSLKGPAYDTSHVIMKPDFVVEEVSPNNSDSLAKGSVSSAAIAAGYAAMLKSNNHDWSPEQIKYSLKQSALDLGFKPWEQGAGLVDIDLAKETNFFANKQHISFGWTDFNENYFEVTEDLEFKNTSDETVNISFEEIISIENVTVQFPSELSVSAENISEFNISISVDLEELPFDSDFHAYTGRIAFSGDREGTIDYSLFHAPDIRFSSRSADRYEDDVVTVEVPITSALNPFPFFNTFQFKTESGNYKAYAGDYDFGLEWNIWSDGVDVVQVCQKLSPFNLSKSNPRKSVSLDTSTLTQIPMNIKDIDGNHIYSLMPFNRFNSRGNLQIGCKIGQPDYEGMFYTNYSQENTEFDGYFHIAEKDENNAYAIDYDFSDGTNSYLNDDDYFNKYLRIKYLYDANNPIIPNNVEIDFDVRISDGGRHFQSAGGLNYHFLRKGEGLTSSFQSIQPDIVVKEIDGFLSYSSSLLTGNYLKVEGGEWQIDHFRQENTDPSSIIPISVGYLVPFFTGKLMRNDGGIFSIESTSLAVFADDSYSSYKLPVYLSCDLCTSFNAENRNIAFIEDIDIGSVDSDQKVQISVDFSSEEFPVHINRQPSSISAILSFFPNAEDYSPPKITRLATLSGKTINSILPLASSSSISFVLEDESPIDEVKFYLIVNGEEIEHDTSFSNGRYSIQLGSEYPAEDIGIKLFAIDSHGNRLDYSATNAFKFGPCENDIDCDHVLDGEDAFPENPYEYADSDNDGIGNNEESDNDGDGISDEDEILMGLNPLSPDTDGDGFLDGDDLYPTDPSKVRDYKPFDFDGDGKADIAVRRASTGIQYILNSSGNDVGSDKKDGVQRHVLGDRATDIPIVGDFDGDGIGDLGVRRPSTFEWIIRHSSTGEIVTTVFGRNEDDIPVPADYDGDGTTDLAVRRPSNFTWYILNSSGVDDRTNKEDGISRVVFGRREADIPVPADYDGDGRADVAVRRASNYTWYIKNSSGSNFNSDKADGIQRVVFGRDEFDIPVPADYTGDGYADIAVRRASNFTWYIKNSDGSNFNSDKGDGIQRIRFGTRELDIPVPADYDGDGIADVAVRRASNQLFYIKNSDDTNFNSDKQDGIQRINFGKQEDDIPVVAPYSEIERKMNFVNSGFKADIVFANDSKSAKVEFAFDLSDELTETFGGEAFIDGVIMNKEYARVETILPNDDRTDGVLTIIPLNDGNFVAMETPSAGNIYSEIEGGSACNSNTTLYGLKTLTGQIRDVAGNVLESGVEYKGIPFSNQTKLEYASEVLAGEFVNGDLLDSSAYISGFRITKEDGSQLVVCGND